MISDEHFMLNSIVYTYRKITSIFQRHLNKDLNEDAASSNKNSVGPIISALRRERQEKHTHS